MAVPERRASAAYHFRPRVWDGMFLLLDPLHPENPLAAGAPDLERLTLPGPGGVVFGSGGTAFFPTVSVEVWQQEPPPHPEPWDAVEQTGFESSTGRLRVCSIDGAPGGPDFPAGQPGTFQLRAHCRGRSEASARLGVELDYEGIEEWLIQIWPRRPT
jgi:hypothetical protein